MAHKTDKKYPLRCGACGFYFDYEDSPKSWESIDEGGFCEGCKEDEEYGLRYG